MSLIYQKIPGTKGGISAAIHYPEKESDKLAILCPGYLDSKDYKHLVGLAEALCKQDYTVVRFDPTGTWDSDGDNSDYTNSQYLEDIKNILDCMLSQKNYTNILLGGHSRGGQISILYAARDQRISTVLGIMPSHGSMAKQGREEWEKAGVQISSRDLPDNKNEKREFRIPFSHAIDRDKYNVLKDLKKIKAPILLIAGEADILIPPDDVREIFDNANEPKKFIIIEGIGHSYRHNDEEIKLVNEKIIKYFKTN